jgi:hypothetical protein
MGSLPQALTHLPEGRTRRRACSGWGAPILIAQRALVAALGPQNGVGIFFLLFPSLRRVSSRGRVRQHDEPLLPAECGGPGAPRHRSLAADRRSTCLSRTATPAQRGHRRPAARGPGIGRPEPDTGVEPLGRWRSTDRVPTTSIPFALLGVPSCG